MALSREERKKALKKRQQDSAKNRDRGGKKSVIDVSKASKGDKKIHYFSADTGKGKKNLIDLIPFTITQNWYKDLRTFCGKPTGIEVGEMDYKLELPVHRDVGANNEKFICLTEAFGQACPVCEDRRAEQQKGEDADEDKIKSMYAKWRDFYCIWDYNDEDKDIQLFEASYHMFEKMIGEEADLGDEGTVLHSDLDDGKSIEFKAKEKTLGKIKYWEAQSIEFKDRDPLEDEFLDDAFPLDAMVVIPTYDQVEKAYYDIKDGEEGKPKEDEETEEKPASSRRSRGSKEESKDETTEEGSGEAEPGEGSEEESTPAGTCPADGDFGKDCNELDACAKCENDIFDACAEAQDALKEAKKGAKKEAKEDKSSGGRSRGGKKGDKEKDPKSSTKRKRR